MRSPLDDPAVDRLLAEGETIGSSGWRAVGSPMLPRLRPERSTT